MFRRRGTSARDQHTVNPQRQGEERSPRRGRRYLAGFSWVTFLLVLGLLGMLTSGSDAAGVAPVEATYHGVKTHHGFATTADYDAWTYGDILMYTPPGQVSQEMANQWLAWQATTDDILRKLINNDEVFEGKYRGNVGEFGRVKSIATPTDSCGAGCGNKNLAEGVGIIDKMIAEPDNYEHQWILFYEQARGGQDEVFDLSASWPREMYVLPHLAAALTFYEIGGMDGLQKGVPADILAGKQKWEDSGLNYVETFVEREQRWFDAKYEDGTIIYPPQPSLLLHIGIEDGLETLGQVLTNLGHYPDNFVYENSTDAICDFQAAVNDATGNKYADYMVNDWGMPGNCDYDMGQATSTANFPDDLRFESNGLCVEPDFMPNAARTGSYPCNGSDAQKVKFTPVNDTQFLVQFQSDDECLEGPIVWSCHGGSHQLWEWRGEHQLFNVGNQKCLAAHPHNRWSGGLLTLEECADVPAQRINTGGTVVATTTTAPPTTAPPEPPPSEPTTTMPPPPPPTEPTSTTTEAPTTTTVPETTTTTGPTTTVVTPADELTIWAHGATGDERLEVRVDGKPVATVELSSELAGYSAVVPSGTEMSSIQVAFVNDAYREDYDRNVTVDRVAFGGVEYESEAEATYAYGAFFDSRCQAGKLKTDTLHCNGYFQYDGADVAMDGKLTVRARGYTGDELFDVVVNGSTVASVAVSTDVADYTVDVPADAAIGDIKILFTNDAVAGDYDRNLYVDYVMLEGTRYESESSSTYVDGSFRDGTCQAGNLLTEVLHCQGHFEYGN